MPVLSQNDIEQEWKKGKTRPVYYLSGEETAVKEKIIKKIIPLFRPETFNYSMRQAQTCDINAFLDEARTVPMLSDRRFLALKDAQTLNKEALKALIEYIQNPCDTSCMIIAADFGRNKDQIREVLTAESAEVQCPKKTAEEALVYLNNALFPEVKSDGQALELIIECTSDTGISSLDNEAEKIKTYMHNSGKSIFSMEDAAEICGYSPKVSPYALGNFIMDKNTPEAMRTAGIMLANGNDPLLLLAIISGTVEKLIMAKRIHDGGNGSFTSKGQAWIYKNKAKKHSMARLIKCLNLCINAESELKSSNKPAPSVIIRHLIMATTIQDKKDN
ncbi:MAG: DNA polymerase III subunit delta [Elusimicrobiales bacterium]|nr:DNA polymerase III subunit delta [Elusimicrobiales bacterium]